MGTFNRLVNILILILALASVALSVLLFQKRENLVEGYKILAGAIANTSAKLDEGSGTGISKELQPGELAHNNFDQLKTLAPKLEEQATAVIGQRDAMATALVDISKSIKFLEGQQIDDLKSVEKGKDKPAAIASQVADIMQANEKVINGIIAAARSSLGLRLSIRDFAPDKYAATMKTISNKIASVKRSYNTYKAHSDQLAKTLQLKGQLPERVKQAGKIQGKINSLSRQVSSLKSQKTKAELAQKAAEAKVASHQKDITKLNKDVKYWKDKANSGSGGTQPQDDRPEDSSDPALLKRVNAKVLAVNTKWDFVVLNIGKNVEVKENDKKYNVPIPLNAEMVIARNLNEGKDSKFICNVKIVKLHDDCAIANVLPNTAGASSSDIDKGDTAYFSKEVINKLVAENEKSKGGGEEASAATKPAASAPESTTTKPAPAKKEPAKKNEDTWEGFGD